MINKEKKNEKKVSKEYLIYFLMTNTVIITLSLVKKSKELGENISDEEFKDMLEHDSKNYVEFTFEGFYIIMTKKSFP